VWFFVLMNSLPRLPECCAKERFGKTLAAGSIPFILSWRKVSYPEGKIQEWPVKASGIWLQPVVSSSVGNCKSSDLNWQLPSHTQKFAFRFNQPMQSARRYAARFLCLGGRYRHIHITF
jgi:hypothetical protein